LAGLVRGGVFLCCPLPGAIGRSLTVTGAEAGAGAGVGVTTAPHHPHQPQKPQPQSRNRWLFGLQPLVI